MSEQVRNAAKTKAIQRDLTALIVTLEPSHSKWEKVEILSDLATRLSRQADKFPAWQWRYLQGVLQGNLDPSPRLVKAIRELLMEITTIQQLDANHPTKSVTVRAIRKVQPGALILSGSRPCADPTCIVHFVPRVPWQKFCPIHSHK